MSMLLRLLPLVLLSLVLIGCGTAEMPLSPAVEPAAAVLAPLPPPTATPEPPTATPEPPTATPEPPTATPEPPTATPEPPTATPEPPTATPEPPTATPEPPTATAQPASPRAVIGEPVRMAIPAINLDRELKPRGLDANRIPIVLPHDAVWYNLSARPGQGENIVLWGHVLRFRNQPDIPAPFARLKELTPGASLTLFSADGTAHQYTVIEQVWATPDQVEYILPQGRELVTMVSCIGDKVIVGNSLEMTHRLITIAAPADR
jgi:sortase (surface protein transpeptidase)